MSAPLVRHQENDCWCSAEHLREAALDGIYPDRCQELGHPDNPDAGRRHCVLVAGHEGPHDSGYERPGDVCHFCGKPVTADSCPECWTDVDDIPFADLKGMFAEVKLSLDLGGDL